jgi:hypothetical protein
VPVVFLITIVAVLVGIFFAATGRGGELAYEHADHAPLDLGPVSAADVGLLRPPTAMWGYNMQVTDEALDRIAHAMRERDVTIAYLQDQLATLAPNGSYAELRDADALQAPGSPLAPEYLSFPEDSEISEPAAFPEYPYAPDAAGLPETPYGDEAAGFEATPYADEAAGFEATPYADEAAGLPETPYAPEAADPAEAPEAPQVPEAPETPEPSHASESLWAPVTHDATLPSAADDATQPSETPAPHEALGPQGSYDTHDWWAEQQAAAREEEARHQPAGPTGPAESDSRAAAEEQDR